ncbi:MAG: hypothetical protein EAX91_04115 [Candidatus Lokiarchaeota archaeon]|nr:hypothetical protein [Candidatus Lokiarchaeota archaeon]
MINLTESSKEIIRRLNKKIKTRNRIYIVTTLFAVLMLLPYIPFWYNISGAMSAFGIGTYHNEKILTNAYGNETVGIDVRLNLQLTEFSDVDIVSGQRDVTYGYYVTTTVSMITSENVVPIGFVYRILIHYQNKQAMEHDAGYYNPPRESLKFTTGISLGKDGVCNSTGLVTYLFQMGSVVLNKTVNYYIDYIIPYGNLDYANYNLIFYTILGLYLLSIVAIPFILHKIIKPGFGIEFDEIDLKREKRFKEFVDKKLVRLRHEQ